jgi:hypothetical protein
MITLEEAYLDAEGVYRWIVNAHVVPADTMESLAPEGYDMARHKRWLQVDVDRFLEGYRASPPKRSPEQLAEIRRELGSDAIDIITGEMIFA